MVRRGPRSVPLLLMALLGCLDLASDVPITAPLMDPAAAVIAAATFTLAVGSLLGIDPFFPRSASAPPSRHG